MSDIWKPLNYKGLDLTQRIMVSNTGKIYSLISNKELKQTLNKSTGYYGVCISLGRRGNVKFIKTHIAVACMFVEGMADGLIVNHIDGDKTNNHFTNLEWVTQLENTKHAIRIGLMKPHHTPVKCVNTGQIFDSLKDACNWCGLTKWNGSLREYLNNPNRMSCGKHPETGEKLQWERLP